MHRGPPSREGGACERLLRLLARLPGRHTPMAQCNLRAMYDNGAGVPQDHGEAARLYRLAADQGLANAQYNLGSMLYNGTGEPKDHAEAARLLKLAADQGHSQALDTLGRLTAKYPAGTRVQIAGLTAAAHLNDMLGTAVTPARPLAAGRIAVRIDGQTKSVSLSWANVMGQVGSASR